MESENEQNATVTSSPRLIWLIITFQGIIVTIFAASVVYMYYSVQAAFEYEELGDDFFPLDHFPGFRISFIGIVLTLIFTEIVLRKEKESLLRTAITLLLFIVTTILCFVVNVYQKVYDKITSHEYGWMVYVYFVLVFLLLLLDFGRLVRKWAMLIK